MAAHKTISSLLLSSTLGLKLATSNALTRPFCHVMRTFTSGNHLYTSSKRKIQTSTVWQPHTLTSQPPPSLATGASDVANREVLVRRNDPELSTQIESQDSSFNSPRIEISMDNSLGTKKNKVPVTNTSLEPPTRPKLRARKAAIKLTPGAINRLRKLLDCPSPKLIKIGVRNRGCSGLAYHLEYVEKAGLLDEEVIQDGVKVIVDSKALFSIIGSEMDWIEDKLNQKFVFKNPNIKEQCGCGESFMV